MSKYSSKRSTLGQVSGSSNDLDNHGVGSEQLRAAQLNAEKLVRTKSWCSNWVRLKAGEA
jgi:hypothetical protein